MNHADDKVHSISIKNPNLNYAPYLALLHRQFHHDVYYQDDFYVEETMAKLDPKYNNYEFLHSWDLSFVFGSDMYGIDS